MEFEQILRRDLSEQLFGLSIEDPDDHFSRFLVHLEIELDLQVIQVGLGSFSHLPHGTGVEFSRALAFLLLRVLFVLFSEDRSLGFNDRFDGWSRLGFLLPPRPNLGYIGLNRIGFDFIDLVVFFA